MAYAGDDPLPRVGARHQGRDREQYDQGRDGNRGEQLLPQPAADADELGHVRRHLLADLPALLRVTRDDKRGDEKDARDRRHEEPAHEQQRRALRVKPAAGQCPAAVVLAADAHRALAEVPQDDGKVSGGDGDGDQVGRSRRAEHHRVDGPARPGRPLHGPQEHQRGERGEEHREGVGPRLLRVPGYARDQREDKAAHQAGEIAAEPPPDQRDHGGGCGHRDDRRNAHRRRRVAEHRHPRVQAEVVDAEHGVDVVQHGPQLRQRAARGRPARQLVTPQLRYADFVQAERGGHDGRQDPRQVRRHLVSGGGLLGRGHV